MQCPKCFSWVSSDYCKNCDAILIEKKSTVKAIRKIGRKSLDTKLWKVFSEYIRQRDALKFSGGEFAKCCTCSHISHWKEMDCGHFISRRYLATKFHEKNNHIQCKGCNGFGAGKQFEYSRFIDRIYGKGMADTLLVLSRSVCKWGNFEYEILIEVYKKKIEELKLKVQ